MVDIWGSLADTAKSLGGAAYAPLGAVVDLAQMSLDEKDDNFGSVVAAVSKRAANTLDPVMNPGTLTGQAVGNTLNALNWAMREGVSEPIATFTFATQHASQKGQLGSLFDGDSWGKAYALAQENNAGQALTYGLLAGNSRSADPLQYDDPYAREAQQHTVAAPALSWGMNIAGSWFLDPGVLAGKGLGAVRGYGVYHKLSDADKARVFSDITQGSRAGLVRQNAASRTDKYLDWINGKNALARPLEGPEILHGTPELRRYAAEPHVIAGLLADAGKMSDVALRRDAQRRILAVAAGDPGQIARLRTEISDSGAIADALTNMAKGSTLDLKLLAANPLLKHDPVFVQHLESQLDNLNTTGDIDKFMDAWNNRQELLLGTKNTLHHLPGQHQSGIRAVARLNEKGVVREAAQKVDEWAARGVAEVKGASTLYQKGAKSVPLLVVKTAQLGSSVYLKAPLKVADALRQTHFTGVASLHDWGGATTQLDSMMRLTGVAPGERMKALSEAYLAKSEPEMMRAIDKIESISMRSLAQEFSAKSGREIDRDYIETLMTEHAQRRGQALAHLRGRSYAATDMPDSMLATRGQSMGAADEAARAAGNPDKLGKGFSAKPQGKWRVDQINDDGVPLSLPVLDTQLANSVPLLDMGIARKLLERDNGHLARLSRAWKDESLELRRLSNLKGQGAKGLDKAIEAKAATVDWLVHAGQQAMRVWKFSVLFRLGYPMRVLMDDHWRIWTQMNAATFYGDNGKEFAANLWNNNVTRRTAARAAIHDLKVRRQEILDELEGDRMVAHLERQSDLRKAQRALGVHERAAKRLRKELEDADTKASLGLSVDRKALKEKLAEAEKGIADQQAHATYLAEQLGDYGPLELKRELEGIEEMIRGGVKGQMEDKRHIGSADFVLDKKTGAKVEGAFGGLHGTALRGISSSKGTFDTQLAGVEDRMYSAGMGGAHRVVQPDEAGHLEAWADVLNHQFRQSLVAMHFIKGGDIDSFVPWIKAPEQAELRRRVSHFAHDAQDWGGRVQAMVDDYIPSDELRQAVESGRVSARQLGKMFPEHMRPAVHGRAAADNLGISERTLGVGKAMNRIYKFLGEMPTDRLSRHPFFNSLYKQHAKSIYETRRIAYADAGKKFTQQDFDDIAQSARKLALNDLKRTLFDISAHSHAAHVLRFVSPFFAAHQESIARWWRIVGDDPAIIRRFAQAFDTPRHLHLVVDENGELVKPGDDISSKHHLLLQLPEAFGGPDPTKKQATWQISESAFNLILQNGISNPGLGPIVQVPLEYLARKYADQPEIERVARVFNPYPPQSPMEAAIPATFKRLSAYTYGKTGVDPSLGLGIGQREYNDAYAQHVQDLMVDFQIQHGREPNQTESRELMLRAGREATTQMFHRFLWNSLSPAPAQPNSKYSAVQHGWYRIAEQARTEGKDFDWAYAQFKDKWGEAYMPLVYSTANNVAGLDATAGTVAALKRYRGVLDRVDPALSRAVIGAYADDLAQGDASMGEYSQEARAYLRSAQVKPGSPGKYYAYDDPATAMEDQMARRGWQQYGELTGALTAQAQAMGLNSYTESDQLVALKRAGVAKLRAENWAFDKDYGSFDSTQYDRYLNDMRTIIASPALANDAERTDIQTLAAYVQLRDMFTGILAQRQEQGFGGPDAAANEDIRKVFTLLVGKLVESNTYFETNIYNGLVERDPLLIGD